MAIKFTKGGLQSVQSGKDKVASQFKSKKGGGGGGKAPKSGSSSGPEPEVQGFSTQEGEVFKPVPKGPGFSKSGVVQVGKDTPREYLNAGVVQPARSASVGQTASRIRDETQRSGFGAGIRLAGGTIASRAKSFFQRGFNVSKEEKAARREAKVQAGIDKINKGAPSTNSPQAPGAGFRVPLGNQTAELYGGNVAYTDDQVVEIAATYGVSKEAAIKVISDRETSKISNETQAYANQQIPKYQEIGKASIEKTKADLINAVQRGDISAQAANDILDKKVAEVNRDIDEKFQKDIKDFSSPKIENAEKRLEKIKDRITIQRIIIASPAIAAGTVALGGAGAFIAATGAGAATAVTATGYGVTALGVLQEGKYLFESYRLGTLSVSKVASALIPLGIGVAAGVGSSRLISGPRLTSAEQLRMQNIDTWAEVKPIGRPRALTSEADVNVLKISPSQKLELIGRINAGERVSYQSYKLEARSPGDEKLLNKALPTRSINAVEVTNVQGNLIDRIAVARIKVGRGFAKSNQQVLSTSQGELLQSPQGVITAELTTQNLIGRNLEKINVMRQPGNIKVDIPESVRLKQLGEYSKTASKIRSRVEYIRDSNTGQIKGRTLDSESVTVRGPRVRARQTKPYEFEPISFKDLKAAADSGEFSSYPKELTTSKEIQKLVGKSQKVKGIEAYKEVVSKDRVDILDEKYAVITRGARYKTVTEDVKSNILKEPIPFESSRTMKSLSQTEDLVSFDTPQVKRGRGRPRKYPKPKPINEQQRIDELPTSVGGGGKGQSQFLQSGPQVKFEDFDIGSLPSQDLSQEILQATRTGVTNLNRARTTPKVITIPKIANRIKIDDIQLKSQDLSFTPSKLATSPTTTKNQIKDLNKVFNTELQSPKLAQQEQLTLEQLQQPQTKVSGIPGFPIPQTPKFRIPYLPFPNQKSPKTNQEFRKQQKKAFKSLRKYTASLAAAAVQAKPVKVTRKQLDKLNQSTFTGVEARPVIQLIDENSLDKSSKTSVKF